MSQTPNRLLQSTSPYLLQHAYNPVDWFAWGEEAFQKAADENKLVLISIGYSACHWCHVMEKEVFEDLEAAEYMNQNFVCIKVDREERPDVDHTYMDAVQLMGQRGGWPLNVFTLPDGRPVYGGTYFPKEKWLSILENLIDLHRHQHEKIVEYAKAVEEGLIQIDLIPRQDEFQLSQDATSSLFFNWQKYLDPDKGGSRGAPKFPMPSHLQLLIETEDRSDNHFFTNYLKTTLHQMATGGIYDQIQGGFARYSVDDIWKVPHFEKMLYDNGQLIEVYAKASLKFSSPFFNRIACQTADFVLSNWKNKEGLIQSASDADSEGVEGKYYVWTLTELKEILQEDMAFVESIYHINPYAEWEGNLILMRKDTDEEACARLKINEKEFLEKLNRTNIRLVNHRSNRVAPAIDHKVISSWNAMFISGLIAVYKSSGNEFYLNEATVLTDKLIQKMWQEEELLRIHDNQQKIKGFLEDYAFVIKALIELFSATGAEKYATLALKINTHALQVFEDKRGNLLWFSQRNALTISRKKEVIDNVIPSSNAVMAENLFLLSKISGNPSLEKLAVGMIAEAFQQINHASSYTYWLKLHDWLTQKFHEIVVVGPDAKAWSEIISRRFLPHTLVSYSTIDSSLPIFQNRFQTPTAAYVCTNKTCSVPLMHIEDIWKNLN